jgi:hydroxypyruvate isomerase
MLDAVARLLPMSLFRRNKEFFEKFFDNKEFQYTVDHDNAYREGLKEAGLNVVSLPRLLGDYTEIRLKIANVHKDQELFKQHCDEVAKYIDVANKATGHELEVQARFGSSDLVIKKNEFSALFI